MKKEKLIRRVDYVEPEHQVQIKKRSKKQQVTESSIVRLALSNLFEKK